MASKDTAMRSVSEGVKIDCRLLLLSVAGTSIKGVGRPTASSSRLCSDLMLAQLLSSTYLSSTSSKVVSMR
jgi:hypothetical protein